MVKMTRFRRPIFEADSELIGAIARRHPFVLNKTQIIKKQFQGAECCFTYANRRNVLRFNERDVQKVGKGHFQIRGCHPAC